MLPCQGHCICPTLTGTTSWSVGSYLNVLICTKWRAVLGSERCCENEYHTEDSVGFICWCLQWMYFENENHDVLAQYDEYYLFWDKWKKPFILRQSDLVCCFYKRRLCFQKDQLKLDERCWERQNFTYVELYLMTRFCALTGDDKGSSSNLQACSKQHGLKEPLVGKWNLSSRLELSSDSPETLVKLFLHLQNREGTVFPWDSNGST